MALINCSECKAQVSTSAQNCPQCGAPVPVEALVNELSESQDLCPWCRTVVDERSDRHKWLGFIPSDMLKCPGCRAIRAYVSTGGRNNIVYGRNGTILMGIPVPVAVGIGFAASPLWFVSLILFGVAAASAWALRRGPKWYRAA